MSLSQETRDVIETTLNENRVVLFMKGTPDMPQCGFSAKTAGILSSMLPEYHTVNVLADPEIREGIKVFGDWPTIPQLYIDGELVGGCDIVSDMYNKGELHNMLGVDAPDRTPPSITISELAVKNIGEVMAAHPDLKLHFSIDGTWRPEFSLGVEEGTEIAAEAGGIRLLMDLATAARAKGAHIDWVDSLEGQGLKVDLPEAPTPVEQISVTELKRRMDAGEVMLVDIRQGHERNQASIDGARVLDKALMEEIDQLPKDTPIAFICHHGNSSQGAAEHYRREGFTQLANVVGGINAWSLEVDPSIPQY